MKEAIRTYLIADATVAGIIGIKAYSFPAPQEASLPYVVISRITETPGRNLIEPDELYRELWQIDCYHTSDILAEALKNAVRNRLDVCAPFTMGSFSVYNMFLESSNDLSTLESDASEKTTFRKQMDFIVIRKKTKNS